MSCKTCGGQASIRRISEISFDNETAQVTVKEYQTPFTVTIPAVLAVDNDTPRAFIIDSQTFELPTVPARWLKQNYPGAYEITEFNTIEVSPVAMFDNKQPEQPLPVAVRGRKAKAK